MTDKPLSDTERREKLWDLIKDVKDRKSVV